MAGKWRFLGMKPLKICRKVRGGYQVIKNTFGLEIYQEDWLSRDGVLKDFILFDLKNVGNILGLTKDGKVIVIKEFRPTLRDYVWQLPAGTVEGPESPVKMIKREFLEETGYKTGKLISLGYHLLSTGRSKTRVYQFLALGCERVKEPNLDPGEDIKTILMPLLKLVNLIKCGKIKDHTTQITVFRTLLYLGLVPYNSQRALRRKLAFIWGERRNFKRRHAP